MSSPAPRSRRAPRVAASAVLPAALLPAALLPAVLLSVALIPVFIIALGASARASAHGLGGVATEVLTSTADGAPRIVKLTTGLAIQNPAGAWTFVCEARWGGDEAPLMAAAAASPPVWIAGADALYALAADGALSVATDALTSLTIRALVASPTSAHAVALSQSTLWRLDGPDGPKPWLALQDPWTSAAASPLSVTLARTDDDGTLWILDLPWGATTPDDGALAAFPPDTPGARVSTLRQTPDVLFVHSLDGALFSLSILQLERTHGQASLRVVASADAPIFGPARAQGTLWVLSHQTLGSLDLDASPPAITWTTLEAACISQHRDAALVCALPDLWRLDATQLSAPVFRVADLQYPNLGDLDPDAAARCLIDWKHFATEAALDPDAPPPPRLSTDCACGSMRATSSTAPHALAALSALALAALALLCVKAIARARSHMAIQGQSRGIPPLPMLVLCSRSAPRSPSRAQNSPLRAPRVSVHPPLHPNR